jgi:hypothetical protein
MERMAPEPGSGRVADGEMLRAQCLVIERIAGEVAELILHPDCPSLGANMIRSVAASPAFAELLKYCEAEAEALIRANIEIVHALVEALIERGILTGEEIDTIIAQTISTQSVIEKRQRRADWQRTAESAARFQIGASPRNPCRPTVSK